ncbi:hypothetical protein R1flu_015213 [Riccia fluitans]|uniref:Uncharacterized protein n=1 Tax=Riccia fluitans TaxID=41844 RepID=A0ABD1YIF8_9MARC
MLTLVMESQLFGILEDNDDSVGDAPEVKVNTQGAGSTAVVPRHRGRPGKDKASPTNGSVWAEKKRETRQYAQ